jgi:predicted phosphodiesterase
VRLGLISDIHGNLVALEAVLAELERDEVERVVCLGDVAVGPQPLETLRRVQALGSAVVMGNWDEYLLDAAPRGGGELAEILADMCAWTAEQLLPPDRAYVRSFQPTVGMQLGGGTSLLAFHGSPRSSEDQILATTPDEELEAMLRGHEASLFAGGHTHFQLFRRHGEAAVVNVGSVGLPFRRMQLGVMQIAPWAEYCVVTADQGGLAVELRRASFEIEEFTRLMLGSGMPHAEQWARLWAV